jgi:predicted porin
MPHPFPKTKGGKVKKNMMTVAALVGAAGATLANAQSTNPVTVYGRIDMAFESVKADGASTIPSRNRVTSHSSRLGFRGNEDLGGGLKAFFQIESQVNIDTGLAASGNRVLASRNSGVGLSGDWGTALIGRWDTPYKILVVDVDPFSTLTIAAADGVFADAANFTRREDNVVQYWSPKMGNFAFRGHYSANEGKTGSVNPYTTSYSVTYAAGPIEVGLAHEQHKDSLNGTARAGVKERGNLLTVQAQLGPVKLGVGMEEVKKTGLTKLKDIILAVQYATGPHTVFGSYVRGKDGGAPGAEQPEGKLITLGYAYALSKRTSLRAHYAKVDNNSVAAYNFGAGGLGGVGPGIDPKGFGVGIRHNF